VRIMICDNCKIKRLVTDFINNQKFCYQCMYRIKLSKATENRMEKPTLCRCCNKEVIQQENIKKRQRTVFCSQECALQGHKQQLKNHWTRQTCRSANHYYTTPRICNYE